MSRAALITGITGQDGSYMADLLLRKGYLVYGLTRQRTAAVLERERDTAGTDRAGAGRIDCLGDLSDGSRLVELLQEAKPQEVYHFGAQSDSRISFEIPEYTTDITGLSTLRLLEAIRRVDPRIRFYQASSCEIFGDAPPPQSEDSPMRPRNPYAVAKLYAYHLARVYREAHGMWCASGILFAELVLLPEADIRQIVPDKNPRVALGEQRVYNYNASYAHTPHR